MTQHTTRREFLTQGAVAGAAVASAMVLPRHVLGGPGYVPPSEKIHIGYVGCGTQGMRQMLDALREPAIRIVAVCDPNRQSDDYPEWAKDEVNGRIRQFLDDPTWAQNAVGGLCGRETGKAVVSRYYAKQDGCTPEETGLRAYADFRDMLANQSDLDAVYNMTPEHLHGVVAARAMKAGKHIVTHKPMSNILNEVRELRQIASTTDVASQLFCSADQTNSPRIKAWIDSGVIGTVREVYNVSTRPFWPQGMLEYPTDTPAVPDGFDWDLWLGPAATRAYHPTYTHAVFRGWFDFGTGALGDMGHYSFHQIFEILGLGSALSVEAAHSEYWGIRTTGWYKTTNTVSYPQSQRVTWEFANPAAPGAKIRLHWFDGGMRPPQIEELEAMGEKTPDEYILFVGDDGKILCDFTAGGPRLITKRKDGAVEELPEVASEKLPAGELTQFVRACRGEAKSDARFEAAYPFAEAILLGTIAVRVPEKLYWDTEKFEFANPEEANRLKCRDNREGWEL